MAHLLPLCTGLCSRSQVGVVKSGRLAVCCACVQANGEEVPEAAEEPQVEIEAEVEAAMAAVKQATASEVTDADVLSALLEQEVVSKSAIVEGLALHMLAQPQQVAAGSA